MDVDRVNQVNVGQNPPGHYQYVNLIRVDKLQPSDIHIKDIAHNLSLINRFAGAIPYSVAEHSVIASSVGYLLQSRDFPELEKIFQLRLLLHDAHEAYIGDIIKPVQDILGYDFKIRLGELKRFVDAQIAAAVGLESITNPEVREVDEQLLNFELAHFFGLNIKTDFPYEIIQHKFQCYPPDEAEELFLATYKGLTYPD